MESARLFRNALLILILSRQETSKNQPVKGYCAVALGMLDYQPAKESLRKQIVYKGIEFKYRVNLARALGALGDHESSIDLIERLGSARTLAETAALAQAIGLIGGTSATEALTRLVMDESQKPLSRAFAIMALGLLYEKTEKRFNAPLSIGLNYRAKTQAIAEILDIL